MNSMIHTDHEKIFPPTGTEKKRIEREKILRPGDLNWFKLWS